MNRKRFLPLLQPAWLQGLRPEVLADLLPAFVAGRRARLHRALGAALAAWLLAGATSAAPAFDLVTAEEARREAAAPPAAASAAVQRPVPPRGLPPPAPKVEFVAPGRDAPAVTSPLRLEVAFSAPPGARIVPASFRLLYGVLKLDLTDRVTPFARLSESGVVLEQARVPQGTHRVFVRVADDQGRVGESELRLRVKAR